MKFYKKFFLTLSIFLFCNLFLLALPEKPFSLHIALGTSAISYGDEDLKTFKNTYFSEDFTRFVVDTEVSENLFLDEYVSVNLGSIVGLDWFKNSISNMFVLKYDIFAGIRIYPKLKGFNFGIDYICGSYTNFLKIPQSKENEEISSQTLQGEWSNGFRIVTEYNFMNNPIGYSPAVGCYWQNMPRNNGYDNTFSVYLKLAIR